MKKFDIGVNIKFYRDELRLKRPAFVKKLNGLRKTKYTSQALYSWETGKAMPPADLIPVLADILQVNILQLFGIDIPSMVDIDDLQQQLTERDKIIEELKRDKFILEGKLEMSNSLLKDVLNMKES